jgi:hypothetical protein
MLFCVSACVVVLLSTIANAQVPRFVRESRSVLDSTHAVDIIREPGFSRCLVVYHSYLGSGTAVSLGEVQCHFHEGPRFALDSRSQVDPTHTIEVLRDVAEDRCWAIYRWVSGTGGAISLGELKCRVPPVKG